MATTLVSQLEQAVEAGKVRADMLRKALADKDLSARGLAFEILSQDHLRDAVNGYKPRKSDVEGCFDYVLDCLKQHLDWDEDYALSREDAFWELAVVLDPYWARAGVAIAPDGFWAQLAGVLRGLDDLEPADVTGFLDRCEQDNGFRKAMADWAQDPVLQRFVQS